MVPQPSEGRRVRSFGDNDSWLGIHASFVTQDNRLFQLADLDLAPDVNDGPETSDAIASLAAKLQQLLILFNHIGNIRITAKLSPPDWVELIRATACQTNIFVKISAVVESAPRDGKKASEDLAFYKNHINLSGLISEMNRLFTTAIGRSVNSPLMMKPYNES